MLILFIISFLASVSANSDTCIIHMDLSAMPKAFSDHHNWFLSTISAISEPSKATRNPTSKHLYTYTSSVHGFSASLTNSELEALKKHPGFLSFTRDRPLKLHTTHTSDFLGLNSVSGVWPDSNFGEDVIIGLVDTGIWPESESFNDEGMSQVPSRWKGKCNSGSHFNSSLCNKKIICAHFFNKGLLASNPKLKFAVNSARDTSGHGTHTASIAAGNYVNDTSYFGYANGNARGTAPRARIAMYKAVWRYGVYESDVLAAIDQAIRDGVHVLSLSLALATDDVFLYDDPIAIATFAAVQKGIFVVASAGNDGPAYWTVVNGAPWLLTVGAGTVDREFGGILSLGDGNKISFSALYPGNSSLRQMPIVFLDHCENVQEMEQSNNKIVVCRDYSSISKQVENAEKARVSGAVFITDIALSEYYTRSSFPAAFISLKDGERLVEYIRISKNPLGKLQFQKTSIGTKPAPKVDSYSSRGPFPGCQHVLKPDILAPGSLILGSWSPKSPVTQIRSHPIFSKFNILSGTSMATPHVAGIAALIKKAHPDWSPAAIRSALMTTANLLDNTQTAIKDAAYQNFPANPLAIGSGHIDPNKSLNPGLIYDTTTNDYIKLLCAMNYSKKQIQIITRTTNFSCATKSLDMNYPSFIAFFNNEESDPLREFRRTLTNVGEGMASYSAKVTNMHGIKVIVEPEKLLFKKKYEKLSYKIILEGPKLLEGIVVHGSLSWVHDEGKFVVTTPIVATSLVMDSF